MPVQRIAITPPPTISKHDEAFVVYVDMLGFSAMTEAHPHSTVREVLSETEEETVTAVRISTTASLFARFHAVLDHAESSKWSTASPTRVMVFSDCAFMVFENALQAALFSTELMRGFLRRHVPVRMGLANGTCDAIRFSSDTVGQFHMNRAVFAGTAIVRASLAEKHGGKGCRIFVHNGVSDEAIRLIEKRVHTLPLTGRLNTARLELSYLHEQSPPSEEVTAEHRDLQLWHAVKDMRGALKKPVPRSVELHYSKTLGAMIRMRKRFGRKRLR
jgi:hypothetical protein